MDSRNYALRNELDDYPLTHRLQELLMDLQHFQQFFPYESKPVRSIIKHNQLALSFND